MFRGTNPIHLRRSFGTAPFQPECMGQRGDFIVTEGHDAMSGHRLSQCVCLLRMLESLPGMFMSGLMFLLPVLFTGAMGVGGEVVEFRGPLMVFVMRSVVISRGHRLLKE